MADEDLSSPRRTPSPPVPRGAGGDADPARRREARLSCRAARGVRRRSRGARPPHPGVRQQDRTVCLPRRRRDPRVGAGREPDAAAARWRLSPGPRESPPTPSSGSPRAWSSCGVPVEDLDPKDVGKSTGRKLLRADPVRQSLRDFVVALPVRRTSTSNEIVPALRSGQDELRRTTPPSRARRAALWATMGKLQEYAVLAQRWTRPSKQTDPRDATDPENANALRADVLFPVRQKHQDILTQLAVCAQGYLALDPYARTTTSWSGAWTGRRPRRCPRCGSR